MMYPTVSIEESDVKGNGEKEVVKEKTITGTGGTKEKEKSCRQHGVNA